MKIAIALFDRFTALDAVGPYTVLANVPGADVVTVAERPGPVRDDRKLTVHAMAAFDQVDDPDIIVVPGGVVTLRMARDGHPVIDWIARVHPTTTWTTSVCTGAVLLGAAGVLDGLAATTHWYAADQLEPFGASYTTRRVVTEGKVVTAAGVSAGIDMALTLVGLTTGSDVAKVIQLAIEYDPQPPYDAGAPHKVPGTLVDLAAAALREEHELLHAGERS